MMTKYSYGEKVVMVSMLALLSLLIFIFIVSFKIIDLLYIITVIIFCIKYIRLKWFYDRYTLSYI